MKSEATKPSASPQVDQGRRFVIGNFSVQKGRRLSGIIDRKGAVFKAHPYDVPREPMKICAFALNHILMMIDTNRLKVSPKGPFLTEEESARYRKLTLHLLRDVECEGVIGQRIEYQPVGR